MTLPIRGQIEAYRDNRAACCLGASLIVLRCAKLSAISRVRRTVAPSSASQE